MYYLCGMAYSSKPKLFKPKRGRPAREVSVMDAIDTMAVQLGIDRGVKGGKVDWKLREGQVYRYGRIWEQVGGRWCPTPVVPDRGKWVKGEKDVSGDEAVEQERIWKTGVWTMKGPHLTWITPWHYGVLNYWDLGLDTPDRKKEYRDKDRRKWLFFATAFAHPKCFGINYLKRRRDGASADGGFLCYWFGSRKNDQKAGIMSFDEDNAKEMFEEACRDPFFRLPAWMMPKHNTNENSKDLVFRAPAKKKTVNQTENYVDNSLNGWIKYKPCKVRAFDGRKMAYLHFTEAGKVESISVSSWLSVHKLTLRLGPKKVGFMQIETTCDELKTEAADYKKVYLAGKELDERGDTTNGLWSIFIPAYEGYEGFVDEDGESIIEYPTDKQWAFMKKNGHTERIGAKQYQQRERDKLANDPVELQKYIRKEPWTEEEAFDSANTECHFNMTTLANMREAIKDVGEETLWVRGDFEWTDKHRNQVIFVPKEAGKFQVAWMPAMMDLQNMVERRREGFTPLNKQMGVIGLDPFNSAVVKDKKRASKGGMTGYLYFDYKNEQSNKVYFERNRKDKPGYYPTPSVIFRYVYRPQSMNVFYDDVLKACWFYGFPLANERQVNKIETYFANYDCMPFMLTAAEMKGSLVKDWNDELLYGLPMTEDLAYECMGYVSTFLQGDGLYMRDGAYTIWEDPRRLPYLEAIEDLLAFRNANRTVSDWVMSFFQALKAEDGIKDLSNPNFTRVREVSWMDTGQEMEEDEKLRALLMMPKPQRDKLLAAGWV